MKISEFARKITFMEGLKKSISIAQVCEVLEIVNKALGGELYKIIRKI